MTDTSAVGFLCRRLVPDVPVAAQSSKVADALTRLQQRVLPLYKGKTTTNKANHGATQEMASTECAE